MEQRGHPRYRTRFDTLCSSGREEGAGTLADLSYTGARLEDASLRPALGTKVRLFVFVQPVQPFELSGHVVRHTENGFAIAFTSLDPAVEHLVDDVAALVLSR